VRRRYQWLGSSQVPPVAIKKHGQSAPGTAPHGASTVTEPSADHDSKANDGPENEPSVVLDVSDIIANVASGRSSEHHDTAASGEDKAQPEDAHNPSNIMILWPERRHYSAARRPKKTKLSAASEADVPAFIVAGGLPRCQPWPRSPPFAALRAAR
jgi:hypothetical protein